jgi:micrococcal nuclease
MNRKKWAAILCGGLCVGAGIYFSLNAFQATDPKKEIYIDETALYPVSNVLDGDTFKVKVGNREITVRMLGIDTPETVDPRKPAQCFGHEASGETKALLVGHSVRLEYNPNREHRDKYRRYLFYVYRDDGLFMNEYLLQGGFAHEYTFGKAYAMQREFREIENEAQKAKKGLWGVCRS